MSGPGSVQSVDLEAHHRWWKLRGRSHVLHDVWNPIGIQMPDDEYCTYAGTIGRMLAEGKDALKIASFLGAVRERMGLVRESEDDLADERVAASLVNWYAAERGDR